MPPEVPVPPFAGHDAPAEFLGHLERRIGPRNARHWFSGPAVRIDVAGSEVVVRVGSPLLVTWLQQHFRLELRDAARATCGTDAVVRLEHGPLAPLGTNDVARTVEAEVRDADAIDSHATTPTVGAASALVALPLPSATRVAGPEPDRNRRPERTRPVRAPRGESAPRADGPAPRIALEDVGRIRAVVEERTSAEDVDTLPLPSHARIVRPARAVQDPRAVRTVDEPVPAAAPLAVSVPVASVPSPGPVVLSKTPSGPSAARPGTSVRPSRRLRELNEFVTGPCNELAVAAVRHVAADPGGRYNPLFLHGGVGTGKTHLLEGMSRALRERHPHLSVQLVTAESFANSFTEALQDHAMPAFRQRFRTVDVLLVDDVDFLDAKKGIQQEFLHTIQQLERLGRQVVLTSDRHPRLMSRLGEELTTRFLAGLVCRLESPDLETRTRIAQVKGARLDVRLAPEVLALVAQRFRHDVREMEGALHALETAQHLTGTPLSPTAARRHLAELERDCIRVVRLADVEQAVCRFFGIDPDELKSSRRSKALAQPRMLAMFLARKHTQEAYGEIGRFFGGRYHSTVMAAERKVREWIAGAAPIRVAARNWALAEVVETLEEQLRVG